MPADEDNGSLFLSLDEPSLVLLLFFLVVIEFSLSVDYCDVFNALNSNFCQIPWIILTMFKRMIACGGGGGCCEAVVGSDVGGGWRCGWWLVPK